MHCFTTNIQISYSNLIFFKQLSNIDQIKSSIDVTCRFYLRMRSQVNLCLMHLIDQISCLQNTVVLIVRLVFVYFDFSCTVFVKIGM